MLQVLDSIGVPAAGHAQRIVSVYNKADRLPPEPAQLPASAPQAPTSERTADDPFPVVPAAEHRPGQLASRPSLQAVGPDQQASVTVSARTGQGIPELLALVDDRLRLRVQALDPSAPPRPPPNP